tara:strand:- start:7 stop:348 length:342 start_codon:yes stop_codon:yes gene_type:complete
VGNYKKLDDKFKDWKLVCFHESADQHARLLIKLYHDGFKQREFFRTFIAGYLDEDPLIFEFVHNYKMKHKTKLHAKRTKKAKQEEEKIFSDFGLNAEELEDIFDILEEEYLKT